MVLLDDDDEVDRTVSTASSRYRPGVVVVVVCHSIVMVDTGDKGGRPSQEWLVLLLRTGLGDKGGLHAGGVQDEEKGADRVRSVKVWAMVLVFSHRDSNAEKEK